jgi:hypothetical protein
MRQATEIGPTISLSTGQFETRFTKEGMTAKTARPREKNSKRTSVAHNDYSTKANHISESSDRHIRRRLHSLDFRLRSNESDKKSTPSSRVDWLQQLLVHLAARRH